MNPLWRAKLQAFSAHVVFSAVLIGSFMSLIMLSWFPGYLFTFENVWEGLRILVPVDAILGPLLTLILFVPGKKGLKGDLAIILILQIGALIYGASAIYGSRPEVMAFVGDRFEIITNKSYDRDAVPDDVLPWLDASHPSLIYPLPGQTQDEKNEFVLNNVQYQTMAERYRPLSDYKDEVLSKALDINRINPIGTEETQLLNEFKTRFDPQTQSLFILQGTTREFIIVALDMENYRIVDYLPIDPWENYDFPAKED